VAEVFYVELGDYCRIAAEVLGTTPEQVARLPRIGLADSALASPRAGFGGEDAYPGLLEKAAVLVEHLARNHPLPDGNKRCAFLALERFLAANGQPIGDADPDVDVPMVEQIAAGTVSADEVVAGLELRTAPQTESVLVPLLRRQRLRVGDTSAHPAAQLAFALQSRRCHGDPPCHRPAPHLHQGHVGQ